MVKNYIVLNQRVIGVLVVKIEITVTIQRVIKKLDKGRFIVKSNKVKETQIPIKYTKYFLSRNSFSIMHMHKHLHLA